MIRHVRPAVWLLGGTLGFALACTIPEPTIEPCEHGSNNYINSTGTCACLAGFEFCEPNNPMNLDCCESDIDTGSGSSADSSSDSGTTTDSSSETGEQAMPCESGMNNELDENGDCVCAPGFEWCNPDDPQDLNCCEPSSTAPTG